MGTTYDCKSIVTLFITVMLFLFLLSGKLQLTIPVSPVIETIS